MAFDVIQSKQTGIDLNYEYLNSYGWTISDKVAYHDGCNPGPILTEKIALVIGRSYIIKTTVKSVSGGNVYPIAGTTNGVAITTVGENIQTVVAAGNTKLTYYGDGEIAIEKVVVIDYLSSLDDNGRTIEFNDAENKWTSEFDYRPEWMACLGKKFFCMQGGAMWLQENNEIRNNFFGVQYTSRIRFVVNISPEAIKRYYGMIQKSNHVWALTDIEIKPYEGKSAGMRSFLKAGNFRPIQGDWFGNFLRNLLDPRFGTELEAVLRGEWLKGAVMEIEMENSDTTETILYSVDVIVSKSMFTQP